MRGDDMLHFTLKKRVLGRFLDYVVVVTYVSLCTIKPDVEFLDRSLESNFISLLCDNHNVEKYVPEMDRKFLSLFKTRLLGVYQNYAGVGIS